MTTLLIQKLNTQNQKEKYLMVTSDMTRGEVFRIIMGIDELQNERTVTFLTLEKGN